MRLHQRILGVFASTLLISCGGGGGSHAVPSTTGGLPQTFTGPQAFYYGQGILTTGAPAGPAKLGTMKVDVMMNLPNFTALQTYARAVSDPTSPLYRHFLTPDQIGQQFGAPQAAYTAAATYFTRYGLSVQGWKQRALLRVVGSQANMEKAFGTTFLKYNSAAGAFYGPSGTPHFSQTLAVHSVSHLVYGANFVTRNSLQIPPHGAPSNFDGGYPPQQIAAAFDYNGAYNAGYLGTGITIGIIGTGPISPADYTGLVNLYSTGGNTSAIQQVNVQPSTPAGVPGNPGSPAATPPPVTAPCNGSLPSCNPEDGEAQIDTQQSASLAPGATVLFYLGYVPNETCAGNCSPEGPQLGISEVDDEVQQAINDNVADVISISYGIGEQYSDYTDNNGRYAAGGTEETQFAMMATEGMAVFVSSGDAGAQACSRPYYGNVGSTVINPDMNCVSAPAIDPNVTSVGGITTPISPSGKQIGPDTSWGLQTNQGYGASTGGVSVAGVPLPSWQHGTGVTGSTRNQPDMALEADPYTGIAVATNLAFAGYQSVSAFGGTSVAAPETAAMWALVLDACRQTAACVAKGTGAHPYRMGNAGPEFYTIYNNAAEYPATFLDIVYGNNGVVPCLVNPGPGPGSGTVTPCPNPVPTPDPGFNAGVGYDHVTGIGVPFAGHLINTIVNPATQAN
jgi:kumamolisin